MGVPRDAGPEGTPSPGDPSPGDARFWPPVGRRSFLGLAGVTALGASAAATVPLAAAALDRLAASGGGLPSAPLRPPATPLAVRSMYLSAWLLGDQLPGTSPSFWNGHPTGLAGLVRVDGTCYVWCGSPSGGFPPTVQESLRVTATRSVFTLRAGPVTLTATFFSPVDPANLRRQCVPMSYITVTAATRDGGRHSVQVYLDISAQWAHGDIDAPVRWHQQEVAGLNVLTVTPSQPSVLTEYQDQASWGTVLLATDSVPGLSWQAGQDAVIQASAARGKLLDTSDARQPRPVSDQWPAFGFLRDFGLVGPGAGPEFVVCLGHVRQPAVSYLNVDLQPYWTAYWPSWPDMLAWFRQDLPAARARCAATDAAVQRWAGQLPGTGAQAAGKYAALMALAVRQTFGATELVAGPGGAAWAFLKEMSSSGRISTVDVMFGASPAYLQLSPAYLRMLLAPVLDYASRFGAGPRWAPHDIGAQYPRANGPSDLLMPIEESAAMNIMAAAIMTRMTAADAAGYARAHYAVLHRWAAYLLSQEPDYPGRQSQPGDLSAVLTRSVALNLAGIVGLGAFSQVAGHAGQAADQAAYAAGARRSAARWASLAVDPTHQHLDRSYGADGSSGLIPGAYPDRLLSLNLVTPAVQGLQAGLCRTEARPYGVPLWSGQPFTTVPAEMMTAASLYAHPAERDLLIGKVFDFVNRTAQGPFPDICDTETGQGTYIARPVVGAVFAPTTLLPVPDGGHGAGAG